MPSSVSGSGTDWGPGGHSPGSPMRLCLSWMASLAVAAVVATPARAADAQATQAVIAQIVAANREGVAQYQDGQLADARKTIKAALETCKAAGLDKHPVAARTHVHLGIILIDGFGLKDAGAKEFRDALAIEPKIDLTPGLATPAAQVVFEEAIAFAPPPRAAPAKSAPPPPQEAQEAQEAEAAPPEETPARQERAAPVLARRAARDDDDDDDDDDGDDDTGGWTSRLDLRLLTGPGGGWASGAGELNADYHTSAGFSGSFFNHATAVVGYWLTPDWMLSLEGRFQRVAGPNVVDANGRTYHPASGAVAAFATATWSPVATGVRPFVSGSVGAGRIRETVTFSQLHDCGASHAETCVDTVGGGPALAGAAAGFTYGLTKQLALVVGLGVQLAVPETTFNLDLNAGFAMRL
jgi:hypothetical protein